MRTLLSHFLTFVGEIFNQSVPSQRSSKGTFLKPISCAFSFLPFLCPFLTTIFLAKLIRLGIYASMYSKKLGPPFGDTRFFLFHLQAAVFGSCSSWNLTRTLETVCTAIVALLGSPDASSPLNCDAGSVP